MYYERHYIIYSPQKEEIPIVLQEQYGIKVSIITDVISKKPLMIIFDVAETHPQIDEIEQFLSTYVLGNIQTNKSCEFEPCSVLYRPVYSEEELKSSQWLIMRNTFSKIDPANYHEAFDSTCHCSAADEKCNLGRHLVQQKPIRIKKEIKWGRNNFASLVYDEYILFCNSIAQKTLLSNGVTGIKYLDVLNDSGSNAYDNIFQLKAEKIVPDVSLIPISNMIQRTCRHCGMNMLQWINGRGEFGLKLGTLDQECDFYDTLPMFFGPGDEPLYNAKKISIISQKFYSVLLENNLGRNCIFSPLVMID